MHKHIASFILKLNKYECKKVWLYSYFSNFELYLYKNTLLWTDVGFKKIEISIFPIGPTTKTYIHNPNSVFLT